MLSVKYGPDPFSCSFHMLAGFGLPKPVPLLLLCKSMSSARREFFGMLISMGELISLLTLKIIMSET